MELLQAETCSRLSSCPSASPGAPPPPTPPPAPPRVTLARFNGLAGPDFRRVFGNVVECCPEAAAELDVSRPFPSVAAAAGAVEAYLDALPAAARRRVLLLHPELAGRLAHAGLLTDEAQREQCGAGVLRLDPSRLLLLRQMCDRYRVKFGFPYVICLQDKNTDLILEDIQQRVQNSESEEMYISINEVKKTCRLRLQELIEDD